MKNVEYLKKAMEENIADASKSIKKLYSELKSAEKLPNDCKGYVFEDGVVCENAGLKNDLIGNYQHQIGYMECLKNQSIGVLNVLNMNDTELDEFVKRQALIQAQNDKTMKTLKKRIAKKLKDFNDEEK